MKRLTGFVICVVLSCIAANTAVAQVSVGNSVVSMGSSDRPLTDVTVINGFATLVFVVPEVDLITNPGEGKDKFQPTDDLIVSPKRFSIPPKGDRKARVLLKKGFGEEEKVYRIVFTPAPPPEDLGEELKGGKRVRPLVKVVTTVGMLVFVEPKIVKPGLEWTVQGKKVTFRSTGNIHMKLDEVFLCDSNEDAPNCRKIEGKRIYPGQTYEISGGAGDAVLKFRKGVGEATSEGPISVKFGG